MKQLTEKMIEVAEAGKRVSNLLGLTKNEDPVKIEFDLMKIVPKEKWIDINTQMIAHGRKICIARRPKCEECFLFPYCTGGQKNMKEKAKKQNLKELIKDKFERI